MLDGMEFSSVEHAYVAAKTMDMGVRKKIQCIGTPGACKRFGRNVVIRADWDDIKLVVMEELLAQKFSRGTSLANRLDSTGSCQIIEGNTWGDTFWGVCGGTGHNHLGRLLMKVREKNRESNHE
jgi:hypothetical protein